MNMLEQRIMTLFGSNPAETFTSRQVIQMLGEAGRNRANVTTALRALAESGELDREEIPPADRGYGSSCRYLYRLHLPEVRQ